MYFLAAQLQQVAEWGVIDWTDPIQSIISSRCSQYHLIAQLESGNFVDASTGFDPWTHT